MKKLLAITIFICCQLLVFAQQGPASLSVTGTVYDNTNTTLPGATISVKDRPGTGAVTDADGRFSIKCQKNDVLVFSCIGFQPIEKLVTTSETNIKVTLSTSDNALDEVVVVGLGTQRKISVVGAVTSVDVDQLQTPSTNIQNMLGGRVPGIITMQSSGEPGKNISEFWIRGIGTFGANSSALVLIDGLEGTLSDVDPADIESFSVLKDASATAIYGVRGANGVVIVTTKRGTTDRLQVTGRVNFTVSQLTNMPEYLDSYEYAKLANEARVVRGSVPLYSDIELDIIKYGLDPDLYPNVNWQDEILHKTSLQQTYFVNARGGGSLARYYLSLGMNNESSAYKQDESSKYSTKVGYRTVNYRANLDINLTKSTKIYFGADGFFSTKKEPGNSDTDALWKTQRNLTPITIPTVYSTGHLPAYGVNNAYSPYVMLNNTGMADKRNYRGKVTLELKQDLSAWVDGLSVRAQGAYDLHSAATEVRSILPEMYYATTRKYTGELGIIKRVEAQPAKYSHEESQYYKAHFEAMANYDNQFGDHTVGALLYYYMSSEQTLNKSLDDKAETVRGMYAIPVRYQGLSGRLTYGFQDTYFLDVNFGYTGSENFEKGHRFGFFPSVALGWVPTQYAFMQDAMPWLDFLKIRASYGTVGNDRLTDTRFPYLTLMNTYNSDGGWGSSVGYITEDRVGANNLRWERAKKADLGIEAKLFGEKVDLVVDFFQDKRDGIYQQRSQIPDYVGLTHMPFGNVGKMKSYGSDGNISYTQDFGKDISFTVRGNFTYSANKVENWEQAEQPYEYQNYTGYVHNAFRGYIAEGLFRDEQDVAQSPKQTFGAYTVGDIKYKDVNADGIINEDDKVPLSYPFFPRLMYGFGGEFRWKNLSLSLLFKGTGNTDYYYVNTRSNGEGFIPFWNGSTGNVLKIVADQSNRWTPASYSGTPATENPNALYPRLSYGSNSNNAQYSTYWKANSRYLRFQEINLNYNFKAGKALKALGVKSLDLQFVVSNVCVWSPFKLWDPEQADYNGAAYPIPRSYAFQMYVNF